MSVIPQDIGPQESARAVTAHWENAEWTALVSSWINSALEGVTDVTTVQTRPWATVRRVVAAGETYWFKASIPSGRHEPELTAYLAREFPGRVPDILAQDQAQGWWMMRDVGDPLETFNDRSERRLSAIREYTVIQQSTAKDVETLANLGLATVNGSDVCAMLEQLLTQSELLGYGRRHGATADELELLSTMVPKIERLGRELDQIGIPNTIQHDDLSDANICVNLRGEIAFIDWADAYVGPPFGSLLFPQREALSEGGDAALRQIANVYAVNWRGGRWSHDELVRAVELATPLAVISKAASWNRAMSGVERSQLGPYYAYPELRWLRKLFEPDASWRTLLQG